MKTWHNHVTSDTKIMIEKLQNLHEEKQTVDQKYTMFLLIFLASGVLFLLYILLYIFFSEASPFQALINFFKNTIHIMLLLIPLILFFIHLYFQSNYHSAVDHFEDFRHEVIDHLKGSWLKDEHTLIRDAISKELDSKGINIRYKNSS